MKYTLKPGSKSGEGTCDKLLGEIVGLEKYNPGTPGDPSRQDVSKASLGVRTQTLGELEAAAAQAMPKVEDPESEITSIGDFTSGEPDENDVCTVPALSPATQQLPAFSYTVGDDNAMTVEVPATDITYKWSNIRLYVTPAYPGTQLVGDMTYTENGCTASYSVIALWPAVGCEGKDKDGKGTGRPNPDLCKPEADPAAGRPTGSGINPDIYKEGRVVCDPDLLLCVLNAPPAVLR